MRNGTILGRIAQFGAGLMIFSFCSFLFLGFSALVWLIVIAIGGMVFGS